MLKSYHLIIAVICLFTFMLMGTHTAYSEELVRKELANQSYRLVVTIDTGTVILSVEDKVN